jgi:hypothetical protein
MYSSTVGALYPWELQNEREDQATTSAGEYNLLGTTKTDVLAGDKRRRAEQTIVSTPFL